MVVSSKRRESGVVDADFTQATAKKSACYEKFQLGRGSWNQRIT